MVRPEKVGNFNLGGIEWAENACNANTKKYWWLVVATVTLFSTRRFRHLVWKWLQCNLKEQIKHGWCSNDYLPWSVLHIQCATGKTRQGEITWIEQSSILGLRDEEIKRHDGLSWEKTVCNNSSYFDRFLLLVSHFKVYNSITWSEK